MADKSDVLFNKLLIGQNNLEADVSGLKEDQARLEADMAELKSDIAIIKSDVAELKEGQRRIELFLLNMYNRIVPIIDATFELTKALSEQMATFQQTQIEHSGKIETHALRIN